MKKLICMLLAVLMLSALAVPAFAADPSPTQDVTGTANVAKPLVQKVNLIAPEFKEAGGTAKDENGEEVTVIINIEKLEPNATEQMIADFEKLNEGDKLEKVRKTQTAQNLDTVLKTAPTAVQKKVENANGSVSVSEGVIIVASIYPCKAWAVIDDPDEFVTVMLYSGGKWYIPDGMRVYEEVNPDTQETENKVEFTMTEPAYISLVYANGTAKAA